MARRAFQQGDAFLASVDRGVLTVPVQGELARIPWYARGLLVDWIRNRREFARVNLGRLVRVSYDANDRRRRFDLADQDGYSLRLLFPVAELTERETAVRTALRRHLCGG
ncbi:MAG: hypothetical protein WAV54_14465 [Acidimicrobiales bacterium]